MAISPEDTAQLIEQITPEYPDDCAYIVTEAVVPYYRLVLITHTPTHRTKLEIYGPCVSNEEEARKEKPDQIWYDRDEQGRALITQFKAKYGL